MQTIQRILVGMDTLERDGRMLDYVGLISRAAVMKEVHLVHVESSRDASAPQLTEDALRALADQRPSGRGNEKVIAKVVTGAPLVEILRYAQNHDIDLIVIGREAMGGDPTRDDAVLACRIARQATCSVLVLPQDASPTAQRILVPVRDSECSAIALEAACQMAAATDGAVCCLNVFQIQPGYRYVGSSLDEQTASLRQDAQAECDRLLARLDHVPAGLTTQCMPDLHSKPVPVILEEIKRQSADLVVIGARGRTGAAGVLLGRVTEKLIRQNPKPLLAVKKKGECLNILRALLAITQ